MIAASPGSADEWNWRKGGMEEGDGFRCSETRQKPLDARQMLSLAAP